MATNEPPYLSTSSIQAELDVVSYGREPVSLNVNETRDLHLKERSRLSETRIPTLGNASGRV